MSRSRKKYPIRWLCGKSSAMKKWKKQANKRVRKRENVPSGKAYRKINDIWDSPSDGKVWATWNNKGLRK